MLLLSTSKKQLPVTILCMGYKLVRFFDIFIWYVFLTYFKIITLKMYRVSHSSHESLPELTVSVFPSSALRFFTLNASFATRRGVPQLRLKLDTFAVITTRIKIMVTSRRALDCFFFFSVRFFPIGRTINGKFRYVLSERGPECSTAPTSAPYHKRRRRTSDGHAGP